MVLEQHVYETNADLEACSRAAQESPHVKGHYSSEKGLLTIRFHEYEAIAQITSKGKLMVYVDSSDFEALWKTLKPILRTREDMPLEIKWLEKIPHPSHVRLKSLMVDAEMNGSIESQFSIIDELERTRKKQKPEKELH